MNELSQSVLRRVNDSRYMKSISKEPVKEVLDVSEEEFRGLCADILLWSRTYALVIDGVPIKIHWTSKCQTT